MKTERSEGKYDGDEFPKSEEDGEVRIEPKFGATEVADVEEKEEVPTFDNYSEEEEEIKMRFKRILTDFSFILGWYVENWFLTLMRKARTSLNRTSKPE